MKLNDETIWVEVEDNLSIPFDIIIDENEYRLDDIIKGIVKVKIEIDDNALKTALSIIRQGVTDENK
jgi:hypothetical protein